MAKDYLIDENGDYIIKDGDFFYGDSEEQEVAAIMTINPGECKQKPILGFGFIKRIRSQQDPQDMKKDLDTQLRLDQFKDISIAFDSKGRIQILKANR